MARIASSSPLINGIPFRSTTAGRGLTTARLFGSPHPGLFKRIVDERDATATGAGAVQPGWDLDRAQRMPRDAPHEVLIRPSSWSTVGAANWTHHDQPRGTTESGLEIAAGRPGATGASLDLFGRHQMAARLHPVRGQPERGKLIEVGTGSRHIWTRMCPPPRST